MSFCEYLFIVELINYYIIYMQSSDDQNPPTKDPTMSVPKESGNDAINQNIEEPVDSSQQSQGTSEQPGTPLAGPSPQQSTPIGVQPQTPTVATETQETPPPQPPPPQQPPTQEQTKPETVVVEKKKGGCGCNKTTCCIGSCIGCILIIVGLILGIIFAAPTISSLLNKALNPNVNVPELTEVSLESVKSHLEESSKSTQGESVRILEDEFNALVKEKKDKRTDISEETDIRFGFEKDKAEMFVKFTQWMPWAVIEIVGDDDGTLEVTSIKMGPVDITTRFGSTFEDYESSFNTNINEMGDEIDAVNLLTGFIFDETTEDVEIEAVYLHENEIELVIKSSININ